MITTNEINPGDSEGIECPHCMVKVPLATGKDEQQPKDGDVSICFNCGGFSIFTLIEDKKSFRKWTIEEQLDFRTHRRFLYLKILSISNEIKKLKSNNNPDGQSKT